jgi:hypothetical protein
MGISFQNVQRMETSNDSRKSPIRVFFPSPLSFFLFLFFSSLPLTHRIIISYSYSTIRIEFFSLEKHRDEVLDSEIQKIRAAIVTLRQQKKLSEKDQILLNTLQQQLKLLLKEKEEHSRLIV